MYKIHVLFPFLSQSPVKSITNLKYIFQSTLEFYNYVLIYRMLKFVNDKLYQYITLFIITGYVTEIATDIVVLVLSQAVGDMW